jgi:hypothetical protein
MATTRSIPATTTRMAPPTPTRRCCATSAWGARWRVHSAEDEAGRGAVADPAAEPRAADPADPADPAVDRVAVPAAAVPAAAVPAAADRAAVDPVVDRVAVDNKSPHRAQEATIRPPVLR